MKKWVVKRPGSLATWFGSVMLIGGLWVALPGIATTFLHVTGVSVENRTPVFVAAMAGLALIFTGTFLMVREGLKPPAAEKWWRQPAALALVAANLVPTVGVLFLGWNMFTLLLLYWLETGVAGICTTIKVLARSRNLGSTVVAAFMMAWAWGLYGIYVFVLANRREAPLQVVADLLEEHALLWPFVAMAASHGIATVLDLARLRATPGLAAETPTWPMVVRVFRLHLSIMGGLFLTHLLGSPLHVLLPLILLKSIMELSAHEEEFADKPATAERRSWGRPLAHFIGTWALAPGHPRTPGWFASATLYQEAGKLRLRVADVAGPGDAPDALESVELSGSAEGVKFIEVRLNSGGTRRTLHFSASDDDPEGLELLETQHPDGDRKAKQARSVKLRRRGAA